MVHDRLLDLLEADREVDLDVASSFAQTGCKYLSSVKGSRGLKPSLTFGLRRHVLHPKVDLCVWLLGTMFLPPRPHKQTHTHTHTHPADLWSPWVKPVPIKAVEPESQACCDCVQTFPSGSFVPRVKSFHWTLGMQF